MNHILERLPILILEPHARCNCRCVMCDIWKTTEQREIPAEELARHLGDFERLGVEWVVFSGGEALMHTDLFRLADLLHERRIRTTVLSSGLLLERYAAQTVQHIGDVIVSLDGPPGVHDQIRGIPGAFEKLARGVKAIQQLAPEYSISARCTVQALNAPHLPAVVDAARRLGLASISFLAADLTSTAFNRPEPWAAARQARLLPDGDELQQGIERLIGSGDCGKFISESAEKLRRIGAHFRADRGLEPHRAPRCNAPWVSAVIEANGDVRPCFFHPRIGNLEGMSFEAVLNGSQAIRFRQNLRVSDDPICQRCVCSLYREEPVMTLAALRS